MNVSKGRGSFLEDETEETEEFSRMASPRSSLLPLPLLPLALLRPLGLSKISGIVITRGVREGVASGVEVEEGVEAEAEAGEGLIRMRIE
jgi:hypothetical protein